MVLVGGVFFAMWYFLTYYFQLVLGYGPVKAGLAFMPTAIAIIVGAQISSRLIAKVGVRPLLQIGATLATLGFFWLSLIKPDSNYWGHVIAPAFVTAFAMGLLFSPLAMAATSGVDRADAGLASGCPQYGASSGRLARPGRSRHRGDGPHRISYAHRLAEGGPHGGLPARFSDLGGDRAARPRADLSPPATDRAATAS